MKSISNIKTVCMQFIVVAVLSVSMGQSYAAVTVPKTFTAGTAAVAADVNSNFSALASAMPAVKQIQVPGPTNITLGSMMWGPATATLMVAPPSDGFVIVSASGSMGLSQSTPGTSSISVILSEAAAGTPVSSDPSQTLRLDTTGGAAQSTIAPFHVQGIFPVTGGGGVIHNFYLFFAKDLSGTSTYTASEGGPNFAGDSDGLMSAVFIPGTALP